MYIIYIMYIISYIIYIMNPFPKTHVKYTHTWVYINYLSPSSQTHTPYHNSTILKQDGRMSNVHLFGGTGDLDLV